MCSFFGFVLFKLLQPCLDVVLTLHQLASVQVVLRPL